MNRNQVIEDLVTIMEDFKEQNDGSYPKAIEESIRAFKHGISSRMVTQYILPNVDIDWFIMADEPEECWEILRHYDLDDLRETRDFFGMLQDKYGQAGAFVALWEVFTAGYFIDLDQEMKLVADWV